MVKPLTDMKVKEVGTVRRITAEGYLRKRLLELGLVVGTRIACERLTFSGNAGVYRVRSTSLAIRKCDGKQIWVNIDQDEVR